ncbi:diguanylate cyclase [Calidifontibacillus erzurumensis]|uniref:Diguanylate cyclase n=1 Tax=Calidifontibacillus erzurumensis TaxID=2741433 RepID=A0A8J8KCL5_9BACI|nr:diguanylate cyclase [Calidifontibacillus erzurumensis]NSL53199.1 diguanylate cyclase [Calidifontibacillus erzurumensis]
MEKLCFNEFFNNSPTAYSCHKVILDNEGNPYDCQYLHINKAFEKLMQIERPKVINKSIYDIFPEGCEGENEWKKIIQEVNTNQTSAQFDIHHPSIQKWIRIDVFPLCNGLIGCIYHDVTKEYRLDHEIEGFLKVNIDMLCITDMDGNFLKVNKAFERILGYQLEDFEGKKYISFIHPEDVPASNEVMNKLKEKQSVSSFVNRVRTKDGTYKYIEWHSEPYGSYIYLSAQDITETRELQMKLYKNNQNLIELTKVLEAKNKILNDLAIRDELTGLYNRHFIDQRIEKEMAQADRKNQPLSMIIFDLDHFKCINDIWGHPIGDEVLKEVANLANNLVCEPNFIARLGGEEFVIIMPNTNLQQATRVAENIRLEMEHSHHPIVGQITASFGVAERKEAESYYSWYKRTDKAMYRAKESGRNRVCSSEDQDHCFNTLVKIEWNEDWESGNEMIDEEHRLLVEKANSLFYLFLSDSENEKMMKQIDVILKDIIKHFCNEEEILLDAGYPDYEKHAKIHETLLDKVFKFKEAYQNGVLKLSEFFSFIVNDVIIGHIQNSDTDYFTHLQDNELEFTTSL